MFTIYYKLKSYLAYAPWCTKNTASQTNRFSTDGTTYIPKGQCSLWRNDAYSRETAVRATGVAVGSGGILVEGQGRCEVVRAFDFEPEPRSIVGDVTRAPNIFWYGPCNCNWGLLDSVLIRVGFSCNITMVFNVSNWSLSTDITCNLHCHSTLN